MNTHKLRIIEVSNKREMNLFFNYPKTLYKNVSYYIPQIHSIEKANHDTKTNKLLEGFDIKYFIALQDQVVVGRVAAFIDFKYNELNNVKYLKFGWLDYHNQPNTANLLMQKIEDWAIYNDLEYIIGPVGFSTFDPSGILIEGFDEMPTIYSNYNYNYYDKLIKMCGYQKKIDWVEYNVKMPDSTPINLVKSSEVIKNRYALSVVELKSKKDLLKYSDSIFNMVNNEYRQSFAFTPLNQEQIRLLIKRYLKVINLSFICLVVDKENNLVGFAISMPSLSMAIKKSKGTLFPFGFIRILCSLRNNNTIDTLLIAVDNSYRNKGVTSIIFAKLIKNFQLARITNIETTKETEYNANVQNLWKNFDNKQHKRSRCYIKKCESLLT